MHILSDNCSKAQLLHLSTGVNIETCEDAVKYSEENGGDPWLAEGYLRTLFFGGAREADFDIKVKGWAKLLKESQGKEEN